MFFEDGNQSGFVHIYIYVEEVSVTVPYTPNLSCISRSWIRRASAMGRRLSFPSSLLTLLSAGIITSQSKSSCGKPWSIRILCNTAQALTIFPDIPGSYCRTLCLERHLHVDLSTPNSRSTQFLAEHNDWLYMNRGVPSGSLGNGVNSQGSKGYPWSPKKTYNISYKYRNEHYHWKLVKGAKKNEIFKYKHTNEICPSFSSIIFTLHNTPYRRCTPYVCIIPCPRITCIDI